MFALVRDLAAGRDVTEIAVDPALVQRHLLGPLAGLRDDIVRATVAWAKIRKELPPIIERLVGAGVQVAPIKGVAYATYLYALPIERPMTDVDLLVEPHAPAELVLRELGFVRQPGPLLHHATVWARGDIVIDLHRGLVGPGRSRIDLGSVWSRASSGWPVGALRLEDEDALVFHLLHMIRNRLRGPLIQVVDAARLIDRCNVDVALDRAHTWCIDRPIRLALRYVREILAAAPRPGGWLGPPTDEIMDAQQPSLARKAIFDIATTGSASQLVARAIAMFARATRRT